MRENIVVFGITILIFVSSLVFLFLAQRLYAQVGNIQDLNFGIVTAVPWFQCRGSDCRIDNCASGNCNGTPPPGSGGFTDNIPASATLQCGGAYATIASKNSISPGIVYTGNAPGDFGGGQPNENGWQAQDLFTPVNAGVGRTSYTYLLSLAQQSGIPINNMADFCNNGSAGSLGNCTFPVSLQPGVYQANGDLVIVNASYTFPTIAQGKAFVFLINGNLRLMGNILVPVGNSHVTFTAYSDIIIDKGVGVPTSTTSCDYTQVGHPGCNIEGFYSADRNFVFDGAPSCPGTADKRVNIAGSIVANARYIGGYVQNLRDLCDGNLQCPSYTVTERPDLMLTAPSFLKHPNSVWQEVAP